MDHSSSSASPVLLLMGVGTLTALWYRRRLIIDGKRDEPVFCKCKEDRLKDKVIVITGATSGIGYQVALGCAKQGAKVLFGCRDFCYGETIAGEIRQKSSNMNVTPLYLDLADLSSCQKFSYDVLELECEVDFLVNNAGIFHKRPELTADGFECTWQTNYIGAVVVTENLIDNIGVGSECNRGIIFVTADDKSMINPEDLMETDQMRVAPTLETFVDNVRHYGKTKMALWIYATFLASKQEGCIMCPIMTVNPGSVWTNLYHNSFGGCLSGIFQKYKFSLCMRTCLEGAQTIMHCMQAPTVKNGACMKDCSFYEKPAADVLEYSPSFVFRTHDMIKAYIPDQSYVGDGGSAACSKQNRKKRIDLPSVPEEV